MSALDDLIDDVPWDPPGSTVQAAREELEALRGLLAEARSELQSLIDFSVNCGDPNIECALQDCHKDYDLAGLVRRLDVVLPKETE